MSDTREEAGSRAEREPGRRGFWLVMLLLFGPLIAIVVLQFTSDENRYISPKEATRIALDQSGLEDEPPNLELSFDEDPPKSVDAEATWTITAQKDLCFRVELDARTGRVLEMNRCVPLGAPGNP